LRAVIYIPQRGAYGNAASAQVDIFEVEEGEGGMEDLGRLCKRLGGGLYREEKFERGNGSYGKNGSYMTGRRRGKGEGESLK